MSNTASVAFVRSAIVRRARAQAVTASAGPVDDLRLFATTFAAGFLFVSLYLA